MSFKPYTEKIGICSDPNPEPDPDPDPSFRIRIRIKIKRIRNTDLNSLPVLQKTQNVLKC